MSVPETATIYCRISLDRTGQELGVQRQERECRELAERRGWEVDRVLVDNDISATSGKTRPAFEELLKSNPERIIVWHTDRLVRLTTDLERVLELGIDVHTVTAGTLDLSTPAGRAVARTITAWATYEGEQKAVRQKASHVQRRAQGRPWWTVAPFGYAKDGAIVPKEAAAIRQGCADVLAGKALSQIAREWEAQGFRSRRGKPMGPGVVRQVLMHPRNAGIITQGPAGKIIELGTGGWDPIIDETTLRGVRAKLSDPSRRHGGAGRWGAELLTGLLWCARCEGPVGAAVQHQQGRTYRYYACRKGRCVNWPREWLDKFVTQVTLDELAEPDWAQGWSGEEEDLTSAQAEADRLRSLLDDLLDERVEGRLTSEQYNRTADRVQAKLAELEEKLSGAGAVVSVAMRDAHQRAQQWDSLDVAAQREVIRAVYPKILLDSPGSGRGRLPNEEAVFLS